MIDPLDYMLIGLPTAIPHVQKLLLHDVMLAKVKVSYERKFTLICDDKTVNFPQVVHYVCLRCICSSNLRPTSLI